MNADGPTGGQLRQVPRSAFRHIFQPSRVVVGLFSDSATGVTNPITLCYVMHTSHRPRMMAIAIETANASAELAIAAADFVLAVPGENLFQQVMYCGEVSYRQDRKKLETLGLSTQPSTKVSTPSLTEAIGNIELAQQAVIQSGDHVIINGRVVGHTINPSANERPLLSLGPDVRGYRLLIHRGIHRLGVVDY
jgi:flavin reductase (DIM6/NTAB) family NADH-FMN oxidoreductase RutF